MKLSRWMMVAALAGAAWNWYRKNRAEERVETTV